MDLDKVRVAFPDWPSELDSAKVPSHWSMQAQAFFCAAKVLDEESRSAHRRVNDSVGEVSNKRDLMRQQTDAAARFCLAFSLELAIKSALVAQGKLDELTSGESLPFGNHMLHDLAQQVVGLEITPDEKEILLWASEAVLRGKYPAPKKPCEAKSGVPVTKAFSGLYNQVRPLYGRLMDMIRGNKK
jgi:hypothetical protein